MVKTVEKLADLTALRDRETLDQGLVNTLVDIFRPLKVTIYRLVDDSGYESWQTVAEHGEDQSLPATNQLTANALSAERRNHLRKKVADTAQLLQSETLTLLPLGDSTDNSKVLEIIADPPLNVETLRMVQAILRLYQNYSNLLDYGERDSLTKLLNRKSFDNAFLKATVHADPHSTKSNDVEYWGSERRQLENETNYWLAMIDIDHFKRVNDGYGHLIGDEVLLLLADMMRDHFRSYDSLYRFGGEEFAVIMRTDTTANALIALDRLRQLTQQRTFPQVGNITISIGFTEIRAGDVPASAIDRADKALYHAKAHGRNQVCNYDLLVVKGEIVPTVDTAGDMELF